MGANQDRACPELLPIVCYYGKLSKRDKKVPPHLPVYSIFCYCQVGIAARVPVIFLRWENKDGVEGNKQDISATGDREAGATAAEAETGLSRPFQA
jgi:hypothetical protein